MSGSLPPGTRVAVGSDHAGVRMKAALIQTISDLGYEAIDLGTFDTGSVDYPDIAERVARAVSEGGAERGVLVCGTGNGMAMAANRVPGILAAVCNEVVTARYSRLHNDANVLCLGERIAGPAVADEILRTWLATGFEGGRHARRLEKIVALESVPRPGSS